jgi:DNA helicase HerA-like ATPase
MVMRVVRGVWSGSHFSPDCVFLRGKDVVRNFTQILRRSLLRSYVTEMSSVRLSSLVHIPEEPHPPLTRATPPLFEAPDPKNLSNNGSAAHSPDGVVKFGEVQSVGGGLYELALPLEYLGKHMSVFGESGSGKTCAVINLLRQVQQHESTSGVPFLVLDQKGEYRSLVPSLEDQAALRLIYFMPASRLAPLKINLFDPQGESPQTHVKHLFGIIREVLFASGRTELSPQMERVFYDVLEMNLGGDWDTFRVKLDQYVKAHGAGLPQVDATIQAILNRVNSFARPPLSHVFNCKKSNVNFGFLTERNVVVDLSDLRRQGSPEDVRLVANVIAKYVSSASLSRGASLGGELKHLFVVDDALDVVPEILAKKTTAEVGLIEFMAMLLRATGQGLIVVSQRPNVSQNVIGNSGIKVFFRTVVDAREVAAWLNLNGEQTAYLKALPPREAIITAPGHPTPLRIRTFDIGKMVRRKVSNEDIILNNMLNYPLMYDGNHDDSSDCLQREIEVEEGNEADTLEEERGEGQEGERSQENKEKVAEAATGSADGLPQLDDEAKDAWVKLRSCLVGGGWSAIDSEFVSSKLGVPSRAAHRAMLGLRKAGLVDCVKVPNYAYGKGTQYVYYYAPWEDEIRGKGMYGSGVIWYVRQRVHGDLTAREVLVQLSPRGVPSADMIVHNAFPLVIHLATERDLRLPTLRHRIGQVVDEFSRSTGSNLLAAGGGVIVVTLWGSTAELINKRRDEEIERGTPDSYLLCAMPFSRHWVNLLADYALHHITLRTFLKGGEEEREGGECKSGTEGANAITVEYD